MASKTEAWKGESLLLPNGTKACHYTHETIGLKVLIVEMHTAPLHGYMRVVNAGSAMENGVVGKGIAHFIEHMSFRIDDGKYWKFEREGHEDNAMTTEDATSFYDFGNSQHIHDVIKVDGHRFLTAEVPAEGIPIEMMAVLNEKARGEEACGTLFRTAQASAHMYSNYHCPTIGLEEDIRSVTAADMQKFRETYYKVSNATFIVVGDINSKQVLDTFYDTYKNVPYEDFSPKERPKEPLQLGKRTIEMNMVAPCAMMCLTWVSPPANTKDSIVLSVLSRIISNGNSGRKLNVLNSGSPLHNLGCYAPRNVDAYIWCLHGSVMGNDMLKKAENDATSMLSRISRNVSQDEVNAAVQTLKSEWGEEPFQNIHSTLMALGEACALGEWKDISNRYNQLSSITPDDVKVVIKKYLNEWQMTAVHLKKINSTLEAPKPQAMETVETKSCAPSEEITDCSWNIKTGQLVEKRGLRCQILQTSGKKLIVCVSIPFDKEHKWNAKVFESMFGQQCHYLNKTMNSSQIMDKLVALGMDADCSRGDHQMNFSFSFNKPEHYEAAIDFATEGLLKNTTFDSRHYSNNISSMVAEIASLAGNDKYQAKKMLVEGLFKYTGYHEPLSSQQHEIKNVSVSKLKQFYKNHIKTPSKWCCTITMPNEISKKDMKGVFDMFIDTGKNATKSENYKPDIEKWEAVQQVNTNFKQEVLEGYGSTTVMMGQVTNLKQYDKAAIALSVAVQSLGGGMTSTLMDVLRGKDGDKNGVYGVYAQQEDSQKANSFVVIDATFTPYLAEHGIREMQELVRQWNNFEVDKDKPWENPQKKLEIAKNQLIGNRELELDDFSSVTEVFHRHLSNDKNGEKEWNNYLDTLKSITLDDVKSALKELSSDKWVTVCVTPTKLENSFDDSDTEE